MANRVTFLVDGFNLSHSVRQAMDDSGSAHLRWLDLKSLLRSYLHVFGAAATLEEVHYFTAYAHHLIGSKPDVVKELQQIADFSFRIRDSQYAKHQFPDPVVLKSGRRLDKPPTWWRFRLRSSVSDAARRRPRAEHAL